MITDEEVDKARQYLHEGARPAAKARAERIYVELYAKSLKAILMAEYDTGGTSAVIQEREALRDDRYLKHLDAIREAVELDEKHRFLRGSAEATINAWQTMCANQRGMKL